MAKRRVNFMLDPDLHDLLKEVADVLPGTSVSGLINDSLRPMMPILKDLAAAVRTNDPEVMQAAACHALGRSLLEGIHTQEDLKSKEVVKK